MNMFNIMAAEDGKLFAQSHPDATDVQIDEAAPKFNPARRRFQDAAHEEQRRITKRIELVRCRRCDQGRTKVFYCDVCNPHHRAPLNRSEVA